MMRALLATAWASIVLNARYWAPPVAVAAALLFGVPLVVLLFAKYLFWLGRALYP